jgi:DHA2 family methylenomycin A resistance protein-like MFS transporter
MYPLSRTDTSAELEAFRGLTVIMSFVPTRSRSVVLVTMCAAMFLVQLDVTVVNIALPTIGTDLRTGLPQLQWVVDAYAVVLASLLLFGGALGDIAGHRRVVLWGFGLFGLASVGCALAGEASALIACRAVQGIGSALLLPGSLAVITAAYPGRREQAGALGVWAGVSALALPAGPLLGGLVVTAVGWRPLFWLNVPLVLVAMLACVRFVRAEAPTGRRRVDVPGVVTGAIALAAAVFAAIDAGNAGLSGRVLVALVIAVAAATSFVLVERRVSDPLLPPELFASRQFAGANLVAGAMNFVGLGTVLVATLYLQRVLALGASGAAVRMLPLFVPLSLLAPVTGRLVGRYGPRPLMAAGLVLGGLAMTNLLRVVPVSGYLTFVPTLVGLGAGMGLLTAAVVAAAVGGAPPDRAGVASGVNNTARQAGGALGVAVFGALAGEPSRASAFVGGLHVIGVIGAALWFAAVALTVYSVRAVK